MLITLELGYFVVLKYILIDDIRIYVLLHSRDSY